jgi:hypothetical protein
MRRVEAINIDYSPHFPVNCDGLCYPTAPGSTVDVLFGFAALSRARRLRFKLAAAKQTLSDPERALAALIMETIDRLPTDSQTRLFSNSLAEIDVESDTHVSNQVVTAKPILKGIRHLIHHPDLDNITTILPAFIFTDGPLYLPHLHALLFHDQPGVTLAVAQSEGKTRFIWSDGVSLTLVNNGQGLPPGFHHSRLQALPCIGGFPIFNAVPEISGLLSGFGPATTEEIEQATGLLDMGLALVSQVWPLAFHALRRHAKGICLLTRRNHSRSHSPVELPGTIFLSADTAECIGDLLCHEASHLRMNVFRQFDQIAVARSPEQEAAGFVSPWRTDLRPLRGIVDGVHAFLNVCHYYQRLKDHFPTATNAGLIYERQKQQIIQANALLRDQAKPTPIGALLLQQFAQEEALL